MDIAPSQGSIDPIFISVKQAAAAINCSPWVCYQLLDEKDADGNPKIDSRYQGRRRLVSVASLRAYAANLPTEAPVKDESA